MPVSVNSKIVSLTSEVQSALPLSREVGQLRLYTNVSLKCQSSAERSERCDVFHSAYTLVCIRAVSPSEQDTRWILGREFREREVGQQRSILDGEREVVGGRVNSGHARAHAAVFSSAASLPH